MAEVWGWPEYVMAVWLFIFIVVRCAETWAKDGQSSVMTTVGMFANFGWAILFAWILSCGGFW